MVKVYQLSRQQCPPCEELKRRILSIENPKFEYKYVNVDAIVEGTFEHQILREAIKNKLTSLPIVGVSEFEDGVENLNFTISLRSQNIDEFLDIIQ